MTDTDVVRTIVAVTGVLLALFVWLAVRFNYLAWSQARRDTVHRAEIRSLRVEVATLAAERDAALEASDLQLVTLLGEVLDDAVEDNRRLCDEIVRRDASWRAATDRSLYPAPLRPW